MGVVQVTSISPPQTSINITNQLVSNLHVPQSRSCGVHATRSSPAKMHNSHFCKEPITAGWAIKAPLSNSCGLREVEWMQRAEVVRIRQQSSKLLKYYPPNRNDSTDRNLPFSFFLAFSPSPRSSLPVPLCSAAAPEENLKIRNQLTHFKLNRTLYTVFLNSAFIHINNNYDIRVRLKIRHQDIRFYLMLRLRGTFHSE